LATSTGYYLYGFTDCKQLMDLPGKSVAGGSSAQNIPFHGIGVLSNPVNGKAVKPTRENLMSHQKILEFMMKEYTVLPVRFGIVAQSRGALNNGIKLNLPIIRANLQKVTRKRELNVKSFWENSFIYEHILEKYTEIRKFRDRIKNLRGTQGHYKRIELGQMVERALIIENENEAESIIKEISPAALQYKKSKIFGELMFLNLSVLVNDDTEPHLDQLVNKAAENRKGKVQFKYTGPSPPASFVNIHLKF